MSHCQLRFAGLFLLTLLYSPGAGAQSTPTGQVTTTAGGPVPYASIGVKGQPLGTVADARGRFALAAVASAAPTDTVVVSCVGYASRRLPLATLRMQPVVALAPAATTLREVLVRRKPPERIVLGHKGWSAFTSFNFYTQRDTVLHDRLGREVGLLMKVKQPVQLESFHLFVKQNDFSAVKFRLNIYAVQGGQPQASLLQKDVIFEVIGGKHGWQTVDLRPYAIDLDGHQEVVASVQWLESKLDHASGKFFAISTDLSLFHTTFLRDKSQENWRSFGANSSLYFTASAFPE